MSLSHLEVKGIGNGRKPIVLLNQKVPRIPIPKNRGGGQQKRSFDVSTFTFSCRPQKERDICVSGSPGGQEPRCGRKNLANWWLRWRYRQIDSACWLWGKCFSPFRIVEPEISHLFLGNIKKLENPCLESKKTFTPSSSINHFSNFNFQDCFECSTWPWETKKDGSLIFESFLICFFSVRTCSWRILLRIMRSFARAAMQLMQRKDRQRCHHNGSRSVVPVIPGRFVHYLLGWIYNVIDVDVISLMAMGKQHILIKSHFWFFFCQGGIC